MASSVPRIRRRVRDLQDYHDVVLNWERTKACGNYFEEFRYDRNLGPILNINWVLLQVLELEKIMKEVNISLLQATCYGEDLQVVCCLFRSLDIQPIGFVRFEEVWLPVEMRIELSCGSCAKIRFSEETKEKPESIQLKVIEQLEVIPFEHHTLPMIHGLLRCGVDPRFWCPMGLLHIGKLWWPMLCEEFKKYYFTQLCDCIVEERKGISPIYPEAVNTFAWTRYCSPEDVKIVILGQDPYPTGNKATGLAFSLPSVAGMPLSDSLVGIFEALKKDLNFRGIPFQIPYHGNLEGWAKQGVLLLNTALTVRHGEADSHNPIKFEEYGCVSWHDLTDAVINYIASKNVGVVFLLWGDRARSKKELIECHNHPLPTLSGTGTIPRHLVLESYHPAYKLHNDLPPKSGIHSPYCQNLRCRPLFSKAMTFLQLHNKLIDWRSLPPFTLS